VVRLWGCWGWGGGGGGGGGGLVDLRKGFVGKTLKITEDLEDLDVVGEIA
jgi:hypothetical protein